MIQKEGSDIPGFSSRLGPLPHVIRKCVLIKVISKCVGKFKLHLGVLKYNCAVIFLGQSTGHLFQKYKFYHRSALLINNMSEFSDLPKKDGIH